MAMEVGAAMALDAGFYGHVQSVSAIDNDKLWPYPWLDEVTRASIVVNTDGKRFADGYTLDQVFDEAVEFVIEHWSAIDGAAAALLHLGRADGVVTSKKMVKIVDYIKSRSWEARPPLHQPPDKNSLDNLFDWVTNRPHT
jgi:hypothetical protein